VPILGGIIFFVSPLAQLKNSSAVCFSSETYLEKLSRLSMEQRLAILADLDRMDNRD
jgi:hypothetical protein